MFRKKEKTAIQPTLLEPNDSYPIFNALSERDGDIDQLISALTTHGRFVDTPDPLDYRCLTPMHVAAANGNLRQIEELVRFGSKALNIRDTRGWTPLHLAVSYGSLEVVEALVRLGSSLDPQGLRDMTPLHLAARNGRVNVVEALVRLGSSCIDTLDHKGRTPLYFAAAAGQNEMIELFVRAGSTSIDAPDHKGRTPLFKAAANGRYQVIDTLVRLGSKAVDTPDNEGWTPMHAAAATVARFSDRGIETLILSGSRAIDARDNRSWTPTDRAVAEGRLPALKIFKALGATTVSPDVPHTVALEFLSEPPNQEEVAALRFRLYFARSLTMHLLFDLGMHH